MSIAHFGYALLGSVLLGGCVSRPANLYSWGSYEEGIYASYVSRNDYPVEKQISELEEDYQQARSANEHMPPGWHAHLGYLYYEAGKLDQARQELLTEKSTYPESAVFVDRLLNNLSKAS